MTTTDPQTRWFHPTPGRFVLLLLVVEVLLWLSERVGWPGWHKGYAVLTCVAAVGVAMLLMFVWFGVALVFRRRFQFSIRSLLVLAVVVALPCSWLAVEMRKAWEQGHAVAAITNLKESEHAPMMLTGQVNYDYEFDAPGGSLLRPPGPAWLRSLLGVDFFAQVDCVILTGDQVTNAELEHLKALNRLRIVWITDAAVTEAGLGHLAGLPQLRALVLNETAVTDSWLEHLAGLSQLDELDLIDTKVTDAGVAKLQQALPNCTIHR